ncbi:MAG: hypothetical protein QM537_07805 [Candidatus Symbiobacter sp.]|nr:hypothetical protein [Candidatus Symbiobacter sp.]
MMNAEKISQHVRLALAEGKGDKQASMRHLALMCARDDMLLRALVQPFLGGILMHALDREIKSVMDEQAARDQAAREQVTREQMTQNQAARTPAAVALPSAKLPANAAASNFERPRAMSSGLMDQLVDALAKAIPVGKPSVPIDGDPVRLLGIGPGDIPPPKAGARHQRALQAVALSFKYKNA